MAKKEQQFGKGIFKKFVGNIYYFHRFTKENTNYEICLEPCNYGFDVALYKRASMDSSKTTLIGKRICTAEKGYGTDPLHQKDRREETWAKALGICQEVLVKI